MFGLSRVKGFIRLRRRMIARRTGVFRAQSSSLRTGVNEFVTRVPYRYAVCLRAETGAPCGILVPRVQTSKDRAKTGVEDSPLARLVLVRRDVMTGGVARAERRPR